MKAIFSGENLFDKTDQPGPIGATQYFALIWLNIFSFQLLLQLIVDIYLLRAFVPLLIYFTVTVMSAGGRFAPLLYPLRVLNAIRPSCSWSSWEWRWWDLTTLMYGIPWYSLINRISVKSYPDICRVLSLEAPATAKSALLETCWWQVFTIRVICFDFEFSLEMNQDQNGCNVTFNFTWTVQRGYLIFLSQGCVSMPACLQYITLCNPVIFAVSTNNMQVNIHSGFHTPTYHHKSSLLEKHHNLQASQWMSCTHFGKARNLLSPWDMNQVMLIWVECLSLNWEALDKKKAQVSRRLTQMTTQPYIIIHSWCIPLRFVFKGMCQLHGFNKVFVNVAKRNILKFGRS